ncbi:MAG TPA: acyl-CoA dehydrogenase family protein [Solirubrobacteraceae bacterium]|jgi:alkylation response protein AidB-like acyl-CoA dehydrogenase|nr:acyl-CoA dehydrogenase family protein [Solirubrobacteraceae bacterium]
MSTVNLSAYEVPPEFDDFRAAISELVRDRVAPRAREIDATAEYPWDVRKLFAEHDLFALTFEARYGGTGTGHLMQVIAIEEIAKACASSALMLAVHDLGSLPIRLAGSDTMKEAVLPRLASGEWVPAFALSEPEAGSDPGGMRTRAVKDGGGWILNGSKNWISQAGVADVYVVFAVTDPAQGHSRGITAFLLERDREGFHIGKPEHKLGIKGSPTAALTFEDVRLPAENAIGEVGHGFRLAMATLDRSRLGIAAQALGIAQGAVDYAVSYARERRQFGSPIAEFQGIQFKLADMETRTAAARELLYRAAAKTDRGDPDLGKHSAMAKLFCSDTAMAVTVDAVQILGGYGYVSDYPVERMMRDAKITQIYEGTNEIQRLVIARSLIKPR